MRSAFGPFGPPQGGVTPFRPCEAQSDGSRAHPCPCVPGSWSPCAIQRQVEGHENVAVPADDDRTIEVRASGLPMQHGAQLAIDITLHSATSANGLPQRNAAHTDGAVLTRARADKEALENNLRFL